MELLTRARLGSGIKNAGLLAQSVRCEQAEALAARDNQAAAAEAARYQATLDQAKADAESKVFRKDMTKLTMRERLAAKAQREEMLKRSVLGAVGVDGGLA